MNPFLHGGAVAAPESVTSAAAACGAPPLAAACPPGGGHAQRRRRWSHLLGRMALAAGLGLASLSAQALDANTASVQELQTIKGVGPKTAESIVQERDRSGPYVSFQDMADRIKGIGPRRSAALQEAGLTIAATPLPEAGAAPAAR